MAAGWAGTCLHTMTIMQGYHTDLLRDLDEGERVKPDTIKEMCRVADLFLWVSSHRETFVAESLRHWGEG